MELLGVIRRWHHREHMPIREIKRRTGLSRNTIRKYLRANTIEVKFKVPERPSRLDPFADKLAEWLRVEAGKGRKARRTARRLHADLSILGYDGSYARVAAFIRQWRVRAARLPPRRGVPVRPERGPGDHRRQAGQVAGGAHQAGAQPGLRDPGLPAANPRDAVRRLGRGVPRAGWRAAPRHLRQDADRREPNWHGQGAAGRRALCGHGEPLPVRGDVL